MMALLLVAGSVCNFTAITHYQIYCNVHKFVTDVQKPHISLQLLVALRLDALLLFT